MRTYQLLVTVLILLSCARSGYGLQERLHVFEAVSTGHSVTIACSADGRLIAVGNANPTRIMMVKGGSRVADNWQPAVKILDAQTGKAVASLNLSTPEEDAVLAATERISHFEVTALAFSPDGNLLAVGTSIGQIRLFDTRTGELVHSLDDEKARLADKETPDRWKLLKRAMGSVASLVFSPDGRLLASCGGSFADFSEGFSGVMRLGFRSTGPGRLKLWDVQTGTLKHDLTAHNNHATDVAFSPDGYLLASAGRWMNEHDHFGNGVIIWDPGTGKAIHRMIRTTANAGVRSVAISPDSKMLVLGTQRFDRENDSSTGGVILVHASSGIEAWLVTVPGWAKPVAFSPDGKSIAALCGGQSIRFLDVKTGTMKNEIRPAESQHLQWDTFAVATRGHILAIGTVDSKRKASAQPTVNIEVWKTGCDACTN